jgi:hypothetical protein
MQENNIQINNNTKKHLENIEEKEEKDIKTMLLFYLLPVAPLIYFWKFDIQTTWYYLSLITISIWLARTLDLIIKNNWKEIFRQWLLHVWKYIIWIKKLREMLQQIDPKIDFTKEISSIKLFSMAYVLFIIIILILAYLIGILYKLIL